jgi:hypothetical protein
MIDRLLAMGFASTVDMVWRLCNLEMICFLIRQFSALPLRRQAGAGGAAWTG